MEHSSVLVAREGALMTVTLNRPERRNGVTVAMCKELHDALLAISTSDASVMILRGAGNDFCVGADLKGSSEGAAPPTLEALGPLYHSATLLHQMPQVTIAAIDGGCAGAGMGWACACDFRFASLEAKFATAFLNVGASGDMGLAWTLSQIVGPVRAREMLLLAEKIGAEQALAIGLITRIFPRAELHEEVRKLAQTMLEKDPFALRMHVANLLSAEAMGFADYIEIESARHLHVTGRPQFGAGLRGSAR
jgi:2-(1,2-epoxy-1,2-dihydrophenyl)acetyl-CoA isomerase